ncbi:MAG: alpha-2,8-polysialyltransferase family protein [Firmicutes bacterium]|nr:alpha-2,8-polysialyltransferase family protein [Bacillota bacterium]
MIKQVVIFRDFVMGELGIGGTFIQRSISSMNDLFSYQISQATGLPIVSIFDCLDVCRFIELNKIDKNFSNIQTWLHLSQNITVKAENYLAESLQGSLVFGNHSPNILIRSLIKHDIPFLDIFETAYRYMQDCFLGIRSNINSVNNYVRNNQLSVHTMYASANYLKAYYNNKGPNKYETKINENSCLLIGQTKCDTVLMNGNSFVSLNDYKDEIIKISKDYDTLYYKQHPIEKLPKEVLLFLKNIPNAQEIFDNTYKIISNKNIKLVFGLNSGVLYEAKFFGKEAQFLFKKNYNYTQDGVEDAPNIFTIINSNSHIFKINFWADALKDITKTSFIDEKDDVFFENYQELFSSYLNIASAFELSIYKKSIQDSFLRKLKRKIKEKIRMN